MELLAFYLPYLPVPPLFYDEILPNYQVIIFKYHFYDNFLGDSPLLTTYDILFFHLILHKLYFTFLMLCGMFCVMVICVVDHEILEDRNLS